MDAANTFRDNPQLLAGLPTYFREAHLREKLKELYYLLKKDLLRCTMTRVFQIGPGHNQLRAVAKVTTADSAKVSIETLYCQVDQETLKEDLKEEEGVILPLPTVRLMESDWLNKTCNM